jgi:hypothetical protein
MRKLTILLITLGLALSLASCAGEPLLPTATAIPLVATATPSPRPSRTPTQPPAGVATGEATASARPSATASATVSPASGLAAQVQDQLARRTLQSFLERLQAGDMAGISTFFLTAEAQADWPSLFGGGVQVMDATLLNFLWVSDGRYEAEVLLDVADQAGQPAGSQTLSLALVYRRGLWLIDDLKLDSQI